MFEGDRDLGILDSINDDFFPPVKVAEDDEYNEKSYLYGQDLGYFRAHADSGLCDKLFAKYRDVSKSQTQARDRSLTPAAEGGAAGPYKVVKLGAMMMRCGAKIKDDEMEHLRQVVDQCEVRDGYASPVGDFGFRGPSKSQF